MDLFFKFTILAAICFVVNLSEQCPPNGKSFISHPTDCTRYYICYNGQKFPKVCSEGEAWNADTAACEDKTNLKYDICDIKCDPSGIYYMADTEDCSKYYECQKGVLYHYNCSDGQAWDQLIEACTDAAVLDCYPPTPLYPTTTEWITSTYSPDPSCKFDGERIADKYDCSVYYECQHGTEHRQQCPKNTDFDIYKLDCYDESKVDCSHIMTTPPTTTVVTSDPLCRYEGERIPDKYDCAVYYECINGTDVEQRCGYGTMFDIYTLNCEAQNQVDCRHIMTTPKPDEDCTEEGEMFPDKYDCSIYYQCVNGAKEKKECPKGQMYDIYSYSCADEDKVDCKRIVPTPGPDSDCKIDGALFPDKYDCSLYYKCVDGYKKEQQCPAGEMFDIYKYSCEEESEVDCSRVVTTPAPDPDCRYEGETFADKYNCSVYYVCNNTVKEIHYCPSGELFDIFNVECDDESNVDCHWIATTPTPDISCKYEGEVLPDRYNCSVYYICDKNHIKVKQTCPTGQMFDVYDYECKDEKDVDCTYIIYTSSPASVSTKSTTIESSTTTPSSVQMF